VNNRYICNRIVRWLLYMLSLIIMIFIGCMGYVLVLGSYWDWEYKVFALVPLIVLTAYWFGGMET